MDPCPNEPRGRERERLIRNWSFLRLRAAREDVSSARLLRNRASPAMEGDEIPFPMVDVFVVKVSGPRSCDRS